VLATPDGEKCARAEATGTDPLEVARSCEEAMRSAGAEDVLAALAAA
jgi:hypothetical protein